MRTRLLTFSLMLAGLVLGQQITPQQADEVSFYSSTYSLSLSGSGTVFSLQVPPKSGKRIYLQRAVFDCSVDCTINQDQNGTAATGTAVTAVALNGGEPPVATFYRSSDAGTGSALLPISVKAGVQTPINMSFTVFARGASAVQNYSWRVSSITGTARVTVVWGEK